MKGYKIYLTRSAEVADIIARAKSDKLGCVEEGYGEIKRVGHGSAYCYCELPEHLRTTDYECVLVEYVMGLPKYEIVFA